MLQCTKRHHKPTHKVLGAGIKANWYTKQGSEVIIATFSHVCIMDLLLQGSEYYNVDKIMCMCFFFKCVFLFQTKAVVCFRFWLCNMASWSPWQLIAVMTNGEAIFPMISWASTSFTYFNPLVHLLWLFLTLGTTLISDLVNIPPIHECSIHVPSSLLLDLYSLNDSKSKTPDV